MSSISVPTTIVQVEVAVSIVVCLGCITWAAVCLWWIAKHDKIVTWFVVLTTTLSFIASFLVIVKNLLRLFKRDNDMCFYIGDFISNLTSCFIVPGVSMASYAVFSSIRWDGTVSIHYEPLTWVLGVSNVFSFLGTAVAFVLVMVTHRMRWESIFWFSLGGSMAVVCAIDWLSYKGFIRTVNALGFQGTDRFIERSSHLLKFAQLVFAITLLALPLQCFQIAAEIIHDDPYPPLPEHRNPLSTSIFNGLQLLGEVGFLYFLLRPTLHRMRGRSMSVHPSVRVEPVHTRVHAASYTNIGVSDRAASSDRPPEALT